MQNVTLKRLLALALPAAISVLLTNAFKMIDQFAVQWLGVDAQAAVGSCTFVLIGMFAVYALISAGTGPLVARATGAGDDSLRRRIIGNAFGGSALLGLGVLIASGLGAPWIAATVGLDKGTAAQAVTYLRWLAVFGFPLVLAPVIDAVFIAIGRTGVVMILQLIATVLNVILNPLFIYTLDFGIGGAALATGLSRGVSVLLGLFLIWRKFAPTLGDLYPDSTLLRIIRIGMPISWGTALYAFVYWALLSFAISPLGPEVNAALGIGFSALEGFTWPIFWGISLAVASLVGRYLGAQRYDQARLTVRLALPMATGVGSLAALIFWFGAKPLCDLFTDDPEVLREAVQYARILAFSQVFVAYEALAGGVLEGAGDTRTVLYWSAPMNLLRVPLGWALSIPLGFGSAGVWWIINLTTLCKAAGLWAAVRRGRWQTITV